MGFPKYVELVFLFILVCVPSTRASVLFTDNEVIDVQLAGPIGDLHKTMRTRTELPFVLTANGSAHAVKVRVRGKSRLRVCSFPPLRFNFSAQDTTQSIFAEQDKLKLVTHCRRFDAAQVDLLQEYAAYRIFNVITEFGYRVRLLRMTYIDTDNPGQTRPAPQYAFLIESQRALANRVGGHAAQVTGISLASLDRPQLAAVYIFQYLIGNTDWSMVAAETDDECCHNGDIVDIGSKRYYVPYDFDLAGLVNARYAYPDPSLRIRKVTQRLYRGFCLPTEFLQGALNTMKDRKPGVVGLFGNLPGLTQRDIKSSIDYVLQFYSQAEDEQKLLAKFQRRCR